VRGTEGLDRRRSLAGHARRFRELVPNAGGERDSAIAPIRIGNDREVMRITARLLEARLFVQGIRPPTVPEGTARLRVSFAAAHSVQHIENAALSIDNAMRHDA